MPGVATSAADRLKVLATERFPDLSAPEARVLEGVTTPDGIDFGKDAKNQPVAPLPWISETENAGDLKYWGKDRNVRAVLIRWLCVDRGAKALVDPRGLRIFSARIVGALNLNYVEIPFPLALRHCRIEDGVSLVGGAVTELDLEGAWVSSVNADRANVRLSAWLDNGFRADQGVQFVAAKIGANLSLVNGTRIAAKPGGFALWGDAMEVAGSVFLRCYSNQSDKDPKPLRVEGETSLIAMQVGTNFDCSGGEFFNPNGRALNLQLANVKGQITLASWTVKMGAPEGTAPVPFRSDGTIKLTNARAGTFQDERALWPKRGDLLLEGFVYGSFGAGSPTAAADRLAWISLDTTAGVQPYGQVAQVLKESGDMRGAQQVLIAMEAIAAQNDLAPSRWIRSSIGYGYEPENAMVGLLMVTGVGALLAWRLQRMRMMVPTEKDASVAWKQDAALPEYYPAFQPLIFSLEKTFPLVKLGQADKWQPDPRPAAPPLAKVARWALWVQVVLGWILATLFVAGISGLIRRL